MDFAAASSGCPYIFVHLRVRRSMIKRKRISDRFVWPGKTGLMSPSIPLLLYASISLFLPPLYLFALSAFRARLAVLVNKR
jgi:hypothetical protein